MAEETVIEAPAQDMEVVSDETLTNGSKRDREEEEQNDDVSKKQKLDDKSVEEERLEKLEEEVGPVSLGPKCFGSSVEMFDYFYALIHHWPTNLNLNKYEHMVLVELLNKGHAEPDRKIGCGIQAFQVRNHPMYKSRCFFLIRNDDTVDDFSFRKCVDKILPLPDDMKVKSDANKSLGGGKGYGGRGGGGGRGGRGRGRGRGGRSRN